MNDMNERLLDLLIQRASDELSEEESHELERLLREEGLLDSDDLDLAIAAAFNAIAISEKGSQVPDSLKEKVTRDADHFFTKSTGNQYSSVTDLAAERRQRSARSPAPLNRFSGGLGWAMAAMLLMALAINLLSEQQNEDPGATPEVVLKDSARREQLIANEADTFQVPWTTPDFAGYRSVSGDVTWNDELQEGFMRLSGLPANDPSVAQYQLWIIDPERDSNPVDGGVFDIPAGEDEIIIPIDAKLVVNNPAAFAITLEQPGGVVVSAGPLLVVASRG